MPIGKKEKVCYCMYITKLSLSPQFIGCWATVIFGTDAIPHLFFCAEMADDTKIRKFPPSLKVSRLVLSSPVAVPEVF